MLLALTSKHVISCDFILYKSLHTSIEINMNVNVFSSLTFVSLIGMNYLLNKENYIFDK